MDGMIAVSNIVPNPNQPRQNFDPEAMKELINSIREKGIIQPLTVRELNNGRYELIAGERRLRSALALKMDKVPAYVLSISTDVDSLEISLIENIQRENLNPVEESEGFAILSGKHGLTQEEIAKRVGKSRPEVANILRLMKLPPNIRNSLKLSRESGGISKGHARALLSLKESLKMQNVYQRIVNEKLSVRQTENLVKNLGSKKSIKVIKTASKSAALTKLESELISYLGTKVIVQRSRSGKGKIHIEFYSDEDLDRILDIINN